MLFEALARIFRQGGKDRRRGLQWELNRQYLQAMRKARQNGLHSVIALVHRAF
jgi:hypothetical protein